MEYINSKLCIGSRLQYLDHPGIFAHCFIIIRTYKSSVVLLLALFIWNWADFDEEMSAHKERYENMREAFSILQTSFSITITSRTNKYTFKPCYGQLPQNFTCCPRQVNRRYP